MARGPLKRKIKKIPGQKRLKGIQGIEVRPTAQEIKIAEGLAEGKSKKDALLDAGISEKNARSNSAELTNLPGVRKALDEALTKAGVGVDRIAQVINEGLSAKKIISATVFTLKPKKEQPGIIDASSIADCDRRFLEVDDHAVRHQYVRTASELLDLFPDKKLQITETPAEKLTDEQLDRRIADLMAAKGKA